MNFNRLAYFVIVVIINVNFCLKREQEVVTPEEPSIEMTINLPFLGEPLYMTVMVCNDYNVCDRFEDPNPINVVMADNFTVDDIR